MQTGKEISRYGGSTAELAGIVKEDGEQGLKGEGVLKRWWNES